MGIFRHKAMEGENMSRLRFPCRIENGKMTLLNRDDFTKSIQDLDGEYYLELKPTGVRSSEQNNFYWSIVDLLANELGYTKKEMHETLKEHFNVQSTKDLPKDEFASYIEQIIRWSAIDLGIVIPDP